MPPSAIPAFLTEACRGDSSLREELESLLQAYEPADNFLEKPVPIPRKDPERLGPYQLVREIGNGGMGTVYLGVRSDDEYRKRVAVKAIKRGMDTEAIVRRFRRERQVLAALDHPNIARLLDGGTSAAGLPYFVMEYVEGLPIDRYCEEQKLSVDDRLKLFRIVCGAVHFAHKNLVVHRDIKPGNILVTSGGTPKLLDFGVSKLLNPEMSFATIDSGDQALRLMTPEYASPEQVRGEPITTASDVYSLGVLLYELLTGHRPYRIVTRSPEEIFRRVCEQQPEPPSSIVTRVEETITPESVSATREGEPRSAAAIVRRSRLYRSESALERTAASIWVG
ncbi:MAG: serine/threonine protein kinase [Acidobacteriota bacterium]|nr:serine/threonine protein kinase [Acidobacteriota bacterium]